ncbi:MAG: REJ domain-containing protein [Longimicrobiales bacterium]
MAAALAGPVSAQAPRATLTAPAEVDWGATVRLEGRGSAAAAGAALIRFEWTHLSGTGGMPVGEVVATDQPALLLPLDGYPPLDPGVHAFRLRVLDDQGRASPPVESQVIVMDTQAPTAVLQAPDRLDPTEVLVLDGTASYDPGGGSVERFEWTLVDAQGVGPLNTPMNQPVETVAPTWTVERLDGAPLAPGRLTYRLEVTDASGNRSAPTQVQVIVMDTQAPTAVLQAPDRLDPTEVLVLDGSASYDPGGGSVERFEWTLVDAQGVGPLNTPMNQPVETVAPSWTVERLDGDPLAPGRLTYRLEVTDASGNRSAPTQVQVFVVDTQAPTASATAPRRIVPTEPVTLDGGRSSDAAPGRVVRWHWVRRAGEGGGWRIGATRTTDRPTVDVPADRRRPLLPGTHVFELVVEDAAGNRSRPVRVSFDVPRR